MNIHLFSLLIVKTDKFYDCLSFQINMHYINQWIDQHSNTCSIVKININLMITKSIDDSDYENPSERTHTINPFCFTYPYLGLLFSNPTKRPAQVKWKVRFWDHWTKENCTNPHQQKNFHKKHRDSIVLLYPTNRAMPNRKIITSIMPPFFYQHF